MLSRLTSRYAVARNAGPVRPLLTQVARLRRKEFEMLSRSFAKKTKRGRPKKEAQAADGSVKENNERPEQAKKTEPEPEAKPEATTEAPKSETPKAEAKAAPRGEE
jgi:hypothetical protein